MSDAPKNAAPHGRLSRASVENAGVPAPVRIVHMGLGNFHRAHQAWYTARSADAADWGIAAFTGRSPVAARGLSAQDGLYTLIERANDTDHTSIISSISCAVDGADVNTFCHLLASPQTAVVTLTVTEAGYHLNPDGMPDETDPAIVSDLAELRVANSHSAPITPLGRLLFGLRARHRAGGPPIAIVPCDNVPANGTLVQNALAKLAWQLDRPFAEWIEKTVSFVSTSVDRITPRTAEADIGTALQLTGWIDRVPVVTEPFSDWVLSGDFPSGRPRWETAGARFVDDVRPFEQRKLWLLNGAHSLLAYLGILHGYTTVAEAIADPGCATAVRHLWSEARRHLPETLELDDYCAALLARFTNARIEHKVTQIGMDGVAKLRVRVVPVAIAERGAGRDAQACATVLAAWIAVAQRHQLSEDAASAAIAKALQHSGEDQVSTMVALLDVELAKDVAFGQRVCAEVERLTA